MSGMKKTSEERALVARAMGCGAGFRQLRILKQENLRQVAAQVFVHYSHLSRIERGLCGASLVLLCNLAAHYMFGQSVKKLLFVAEKLQSKQRQSKLKGKLKGKKGKDRERGV